MELRTIERAAGAFQQPIDADVVRAMCRRAFGSHVSVLSCVELGDGAYNSTFRVDTGADQPVILRVAPEPGRQFRVERELMRNEHASVPYLATISSLMPRTLAVDFTHEIIGRDYLFQTLLDGVPAPEGLAAYPRSEWASFYRDMGSIARTIHSVRGVNFGQVNGPAFTSWSSAVLASLDDTIADLDDAGLDSSDVRVVAQIAASGRIVLDEIVEPRLLHGDLWTVNVMIARHAPVPTITGLFDCDRTSWGDPASDWTIYRASQRPGTERDAFWETYGALPTSPNATWRALIYRARNIGGARLERYRLGKLDRLAETYDELREVIAELRA